MPPICNLVTKKSGLSDKLSTVPRIPQRLTLSDTIRAILRTPHSLKPSRCVFVILASLALSLSTLVHAQNNFEMRAPRESQNSNAYSDPSIVRTQPRTAGTALPNAPGTVQSATWNTQSQDAANAVQPASVDRKNGYSLPFRKEGKELSDNKIKKPSSSWSSTVSMFVSLFIVIGLFLLVARVFRGFSPTQQKFLPKEVVQVIGRSPLAPRQQMYVIRFGGKLLLVSQQLGQTTTLSEIENPDEVTHLLGLCEQQSSTSISNSFRDVLQQITLGSTKKEPKTPVRGSRVSASQFENLG
jgi:flagellar biogenesis protein FliO